VASISALVDNRGFGSGDYIDMRGNRLDITSVSSAMTNIEKLKLRGVYVSYKPQKQEE